LVYVSDCDQTSLFFTQVRDRLKAGKSPGRAENPFSAGAGGFAVASEGKDDWEIGEVMSISEHGADKHMRSVRVKLGVINRTQAVVGRSPREHTNYFAGRRCFRGPDRAADAVTKRSAGG
jgi:Bacterial regulatory proteins, luxR family